MIKRTLASILSALLITSTVYAAPLTYTVQSGDSLWKIAVKNQVGLSELIGANPSLKNPNLIYPGQKISIPNMQDIKALESEVVRLVNIERSKHGLPAFKRKLGIIQSCKI